jgi:UDP-glucose 4-epimerase
MRIILTGASGNLGQAIQKAGTKDHQFVPIGRDGWTNVGREIDSADVVIHAASDLRTAVSKDPQALLNSNLMTTVELLQALRGKKAKRLLFISSCAVYGHSEITKEDIPPAPISFNGISKLLNERLIAEYCDANGIHYNILRVFNTFGGHDKFSIIHRLNHSLSKGLPFVLYNDGLSQRDFIHVDDIAAIIMGILPKNISDKVLNVGSGEAVKIRDIVTEFRRLHPELDVVHGIREEAEYSRGNITRLREYFPAYRFQSVLDFIRSGFQASGTAVD